jgi:3-hydroxyisobutyrate dehydrogenase
MTEPTVAVLGAGARGAAIAARLGDTGHQVNLRNRTPDRARAAAAASTGVTAVADVIDAVRNAPVVVTLLRDGDAVADVMTTAIDALDAGAVWVQATTIGPDSARALAELARVRGVAYLDAPVSGSTGPARAGKLVWLVSGSQDAFDIAQPTLQQLGSAVEHRGTGVEGSAVKVAVNAWMTAATVAMSDVLAVCDALGIDHQLFAKVLQDGPLAMPYALQKQSRRTSALTPPGSRSSSRARTSLSLIRRYPPPAAARRAAATGPGYRRWARPR